MVSLVFTGIVAAHSCVSEDSHATLPRSQSIHTHTSIARRCTDVTLVSNRPKSTWSISTIHRLSMSASAPAFTAGILSSGGGCDAISSTLAGFKVAWGTEINQHQRAMFESLFGAPNLGDSFAVEWDKVHRPDFISSGQDCTDYSSSGPRLGSNGVTGWQFTRQTDIINALEPSSFKLEMVANALKINNGTDVRKVINSLIGKYYIHRSVVRVESHGDPSNRTRLFIVGFHKRYGERGSKYTFPVGSKGKAPHARYIAVSDDEVPSSHWVNRDEWAREHKSLVMRASEYVTRALGRLVKIGQLGEGMGHSSIPHAVYDWDSIANTQTTYNGGGMRPPLSYKVGDEIDRLRKTTPLEACRIASLDDSYHTFARRYNDDDSFIYQCANAGIPILTGTAIDRSIYNHMIECRMPRHTRDQLRAIRDNFNATTTRATHDDMSYIQCMSSQTGFDSYSDESWGIDDYIRSMQVDTGSDATLGFTDLEPYLRDSKRSKVQIHMVDKTNTIPCSREGTLDAVVMNTAGYHDVNPTTPLSLPIITVPKLNRELLSVEKYYRDLKYDVIFGHDPTPCEMRRGDHRIPFRYDWDKGNFWMDYVPFSWSGVSDGKDALRNKAHDDYVKSLITSTYHKHSYNVSFFDGTHDGVMWHGDMGAPIHFSYGVRDDDDDDDDSPFHTRSYYVNYSSSSQGPIHGTIAPHRHESQPTTQSFVCPITAHHVHTKHVTSPSSHSRDDNHVDHSSHPSNPHDDHQNSPLHDFIYDDPTSESVPPSHVTTPGSSKFRNSSGSHDHANIVHPHVDHLTIKVPSHINPRVRSQEDKERDRYHDICTMIAHTHESSKVQGTSSKSDVADLRANTYDPAYVSYIHNKCSCHSAVREVIYADDINARETRGVKEGLRKKARVTIKDFHDTHGHLGDCGDKLCIICKAVGGCMRRIYKKVDPYKETRNGYSWVMDGIVFNERSIEKDKYLIVLKDAGPSGAVKLIPLNKKSDAVDKVEHWINQMRNDPVYSSYPYKMVSHIKTAPAGEWREDTHEWRSRIGEDSPLGVKMEYPPPERHESMGLAENACWIVERCIKSILMQQNLPPNWWTRVARDAEFLLNRFPIASTSNKVPLDGDRPRPLELLTGSWYSRRQIDRELEYYVPTGTPCLVHCHKARGSTLGPKVRWGIASGMHRETCHFTCPFTKQPLFRSKSFVAYKLERGTNYAQFLGLRSLTSTLKSLVLPEDKKIKPTNIVTLPKMIEHTPPIKPPDIRVHSSPPLRKSDIDDGDEDNDDHPHDANPNPTPRDTTSNTFTPDPRAPTPLSCEGTEGNRGITREEGEGTPTSEKRGEMPTSERGEKPIEEKPGDAPEMPEMPEMPTRDARDALETLDARIERETRMREAHARHDHSKGPLLLDDEFNVLTTHSDGTVRQRDGSHYGTSSTIDGSIPTITSVHTREPTRNDSNHTGFEIDVMDDEKVWDEYEAQQAKRNAYKVENDTTSLPVACRKLGLVGTQRDYITLYRDWLMNHSPDSDAWTENMLPRSAREGGYLEKGLVLPVPTGRNWRILLEEEDDRINGGITSLVARAYQAVISCIKSVHTSSAVKNRTSKKRRKEKYVSAVEGALCDPKTLREAFALPDGCEWRDAAQLEFDTLAKMGVIDHGFTRKELRCLGITREPMNTSIALKYKTDVNGCIERRKVRMALAGHRGAMTKGVDYDDVFSPSPNQNTARLMQALLVKNNLKRLCWDIKLAYCNAPLYNNELIAIRYPRGYERFRGQDGSRKEEEFMVLRKNIYGHPAAGKQWAETRDAYILERFNRPGWTCTRSIYDPTLFYITHHGEEAWVSIYVDDCDSVGTSEGILRTIFGIMQKKWDSREVPPDYVLGVKRELVIDGDHRSLEMSMTAYIDGVVAQFQPNLDSSHWNRRNPSTPFEPHLFLEKASTDDEAREVLDRGYQKLVGCLLWANRGCFPEISVGVHQMCRVMAHPSDRAWREGIRILAWLRDHRSRGIKFSSDGNPNPISYSDASNKPDPIDGLSQYGNVVMWMGGPVMWSSKKLAHVGLSAYHNEYMALRHALSGVVWMRQLFDDIGLGYITSEPTIIYGDNEAANRLTRQDFVSSGNQYIYLPYHYIKECTKMGMVDVRWVGTRLNFADIFTKAVAVETVKSLVDKLCGYDLSWYDHRDGAIVDPKLEAARAESSGGLGDGTNRKTNDVDLLDVIHANACHLMQSQCIA